jgi:hypothetical protein
MFIFYATAPVDAGCLLHYHDRITNKNVDHSIQVRLQTAVDAKQWDDTQCATQGALLDDNLGQAIIHTTETGHKGILICDQFHKFVIMDHMLLLEVIATPGNVESLMS